MTAHLLQLSLGPVQEFIAAARRTRDLWFGSHLLSEISKAAALSVRREGGKLIFPDNDLDLSAGHEGVTVANVILAELPAGDPKTIASAAKQAAHDRWRQFANSVYDECPEITQIVYADTWNKQVEDVIEFYAAWVSFTPETYPKQRKRLARLLAGRKRCRDFLPAKGREGVFKSSLDGLRETVFRDRDQTQ
jgi:CRISPR-associated protein Cmr2